MGGARGAAVTGWLAVLLARQGSKRLPGKNRRDFGGKPLFAWALEAALAAGVFDRVLVSTDDPVLADEARRRGAWVPFLRPDVLATDTASSVDALVHAVSWTLACETAPRPRQVALIQPTSPFLTAGHLRAALDLYRTGGFVTLGSMCRAREHPEWLFAVEPDGRARPRDPVGITAPGATLPVSYRENGALFLVATEFLLARRSLYDVQRHGAYLMPEQDSADIDDVEDWAWAEFLLARKKQSGMDV